MIKRHYDKAVAIAAVAIVMVLFVPMAMLLYEEMARNYHKNVITQADIGAEMTKKLLFEAYENDIDIWDEKYKKVSFEDFKADFCTPAAAAKIDKDYYEFLAGGRRSRYHTAYDRIPKLSNHIQCVQSAFRDANPFIIRYAELIDRNGYVPWHGRANYKCTGNAEWDLRHNRTKRIWKEALIAAESAMTSKRNFVHVTDYGAEENIAASPVNIAGRQWGWFIIAYNNYDPDAKVLIRIISMMILSALLVGAVFHVYILKSIHKIYDAYIFPGRLEEDC